MTAVKRAFKYRFHPTAQQERELLRTLGCVRLVYNRALQARTQAWYAEQRRVNYAETSALLTAWKKTEDLAFLNEVSSVPLQQCLRHLQGAFVNFWEKRARYPRFKSRKRGKASAEYTRSAFRWRDGRLWLAKMDQPLAIRWSRPLPEGTRPSTVTVSRDPAGRWHVSILVETSVAHHAPTSAAVGWMPDHLAADPVQRGEDQQSQTGAPGARPARDGPAAPGEEDRGVGQPGQGVSEARQGPRPDR